MIESPDVLQEMRNVLGRGRERNSHDLRRAALHLGALPGVVIDEDKRVEADAELLRQRIQTVHFRFPIDPPGRKIAETERHVRALLEHFERIRFVFLAAMVSSMPASRCLCMDSCSSRRGHRA